MNVEDLKLTDLDYATANRHVQMLKAAVPYMEIPNQKLLAAYIRLTELKNTLSFFESNEEGMLSVCSLEKGHTAPTDMLGAVKPYANQKEQELIDLLSGILSRKKTMTNGKAMLSPDQLLSFLPPEQQSKMETLQMMMQTIGQL